MSSNLIASELCGWLVLCWFIADHAWHVSLETDSDWHQPRNSQCLSNCFQNSGLLIWTTANYCTLPQSFCVLGYDWTLDITNHAPIGRLRGQLSRGAGIGCYWGPGSAILVLIRIGAGTPFWATMNCFCATYSCAVIGWFLVNLLAIGHNAHELKRQRLLLTENTPLCHAVSRCMTMIGSRDVVLFPGRWLARFTCSLTIGPLPFTRIHPRRRTPTAFSETW